MSDSVHMSLDEVRAWAIDILTGNGLALPHAEAVAETVVAGERDGCASHGVYRLIVCVNTIRTGKVSLDAVPELSTPSRAVTRVDARGGYAQLAFKTGLPRLVETAKANGLAALALNNCIHFAAVWPEIEAVVAHGLVALACTPSHAWVAPAGGTRPIFGTNPIAFGWPRPGPYPYVFDFATSAVARGEIELHRRSAKPIPEGWGIDADGRPTTSAEAALGGAMLTFGGHKGSALATMVELIAGPLIGDMTSVESIAADDGAGASPLGGELILALDPAGFLGEAAAENLQRAETLFEGITSQGARLPSERRFTARARSLASGGVDIPRKLHDDIEALRRS